MNCKPTYINLTRAGIVALLLCPHLVAAQVVTRAPKAVVKTVKNGAQTTTAIRQSLEHAQRQVASAQRRYERINKIYRQNPTATNQRRLESAQRSQQIAQKRLQDIIQKELVARQKAPFKKRTPISAPATPAIKNPPTTTSK